MSENSNDVDKKPYNTCIDCEFLGKKCDGPNFLAMTKDQRVEWCRLRKNLMQRNDPKWTNQYISDITGLSKASVDRFFRAEVDDIRVSTLSMMMNVLINGDKDGWKQSPCAMTSLNPNADEELQKRCKALEDMNDRLKSDVSHKDERIDFIIDQIKNKDKQISDMTERMKERTTYMKRKDRIIGLLFGLLVVAITGLIVVLAIT